MSFDAMMRELQREYLAALPEKISDIESHFLKWDIAVLREDFHKLKGTGQTYGVPEISQIGEAVEIICLTQPDSLAEILPPALDLLRDIHLARVHRQMAMTLDGDPRFSKIQNYILEK